MIRSLVAALTLVALTQASQGPAPRRLAASTVRIPAGVAAPSGVFELRDGRLLVSDAKHAAVFLVDPASGNSAQLSSAGGDSIQYAEPGGFYAGVADTVLLLDRGLARFLVISRAGSAVTSRSIKQRGVSSSSSDDVDLQRVDSHGLAYFIGQRRIGRMVAGARITDSIALFRFDAARQRADTVALLRQREMVVTQAGGSMTSTRETFGSPKDDWGVAPDGRVAVVRASPYRVEWHAPGGAVVRGPEIAVASVPYTAGEKDSIMALATGRISIGMVGGPATNGATNELLFAPAKPPFDRDAVIVAPDGHVWVARTPAAGATGALYDVFDALGNRVDRVECPMHCRVIGFGRNAMYAVEPDAHGALLLKKYKLS